MIDRERAIQAALRSAVLLTEEAQQAVDAILALPDPERDAAEANARVWTAKAEANGRMVAERDHELALLRPVVEAARVARQLCDIRADQDAYRVLDEALAALDGER